MALRRSVAVLSPQPVVERILETIPVVGAPAAAFMNKNTYAELAELKKEDDPAAAVTTRFVENQKKLVAVRISRLRTEYQEFLDSPIGSDAASPLFLARTVVLSAVMYAIGFYITSGYGCELPVVGRIVGDEMPKCNKWWEQK